MSHIDEGGLHAYLDGALDEYPPAEAERIREHLDRCGECAERLEIERRVRGDADALLAMAVPVVDTPSFEELRAYVQRTRPEARRISRIQRLGWAASVVLALGAGWMLREGQLQSRAFEVRQDASQAPAATAPVRTAASPSAEAGSAPADARSAEAPAATAAVSEAVVTRQAVAEPSAADREEPTESETRVAAGAPAEASGPAATDVDFDVDVVADAAASEPAAPAAYVASSEAIPDEEERARASSGVADLVASAESAQAPETVAVQTSSEVAAAKVAPEEGLATDESAALDEVSITASADRPVVTSAEAAGAGGRSIEPLPPTRSALRNDSRALLEDRPAASIESDDSTGTEPLLAVPGYTVISVTNLGAGTTPWGVRVLQQVTEGETFEVYHLEPGVDPSILPDPSPEVNEARVETTGGWIISRGSQAPSELRDLLGRLFPGSP